MEIIELVDDGQSLRIKVDSNEESLFSLLKSNLDNNKDVSLTGIVKDHYLVNDTEFFLKVKKGSALELFKKTLDVVKKDLTSKKIK